MSAAAGTSWVAGPESTACPDWCVDCTGVVDEGGPDEYIEHGVNFTLPGHWRDDSGVTGPAAIRVAEMYSANGVTRERAIELREVWDLEMDFLSAEQARELADALTRAADILDAAGGRESTDLARLRAHGLETR